jgi:biopolymer transport protein ExbB
MREILHQGGPILWVIIGCGLAAFITFVERGLHLHRARIKADDFLKGILNILGRNNVDEALTISEETPGPVARIVRTAILHRDSSRAEIEAVLVDAGLSEVSRLETRVGVIAVVAQVAPLLGLLGTVYGLLGLLGDLGASQWQQAGVVSGLHRALITTAAGLLVAIPCYAAYHLVVGKIESLVVDMERAASDILAFLTSPK